MSFAKRIQRLTGEGGHKDKPSSSEQINELRRRIDAIMRRPSLQTSVASSQPAGQPACRLNELIDGEDMSNDQGNFFVSHRLHPGSSRHGHWYIDELSSPDMEALAFLAGNSELSKHDYSQALFLDTETTGLSGGTGTLAFLIGLGWFEGSRFIVRQIFARDFSEEKACLAFLKGIAEEKKFLVTFNGKAFDLGLLSTRFIMNRMQDPFSGFPHLDLLHPSRRLVGHRLDNTRLATLEDALLGLCRENDIPGSEIPQRYFDWLRRRDPRIMEGVFEHNRLDILSMAGLALHLSRLVAFPEDSPGIDQRDLLALARLRKIRKDHCGMESILENLIHNKNHDTASEARRMLSLRYKTLGEWDKAVRLWEMMLKDDPGNFFAAEELAKWYEHRAHEPRKAIEVINRLVGNKRKLNNEERDSLDKRLGRLKSRIERKGC